MEAAHTQEAGLDFSGTFCQAGGVAQLVEYVVRIRKAPQTG